MLMRMLLMMMMGIVILDRFFFLKLQTYIKVSTYT